MVTGDLEVEKKAEKAENSLSDKQTEASDFSQSEMSVPFCSTKSFFGSYQIDNNALMAECFNIDWANAGLDRTIKDPEIREKVKSFLRQRYKLL